ncbi:MAG TPA: non-homologous end-joining DNA ligase [Candidatus Nitrosotalea sp.]|nr:non-homologous end-joining DNA ligase [Candidatus Nitrosotalea sp.]
MVGRRRLKLSRLTKVYWPQAGFTKGDMIDYYTRIAPVLLPHLRDRPLTLKRYPEGVEGMMFYEKNCPDHRPPWVKTASVWSEGNGRDMSYCLAQDLPTLVWVAQLGSIELHTSLSRRLHLERPTALVFDLDPGPPASIVECCRVALRLREWFGANRLQAFCKTSGSKGLQVYAPLNLKVDYDRTKTIARDLAQHLAGEFPDQVVYQQRRALRAGKVLIDWSQNDQSKTTVSAYSLRARARPTVSTPVTWDEVGACAELGQADLLVFEAGEVLSRIERLGDLFAPVLTLKQKLPDAL